MIIFLGCYCWTILNVGEERVGLGRKLASGAGGRGLLSASTYWKKRGQKKHTVGWALEYAHNCQKNGGAWTVTEIGDVFDELVHYNRYSRLSISLIYSVAIYNYHFVIELSQLSGKFIINITFALLYLK